MKNSLFIYFICLACFTSCDDSYSVRELKSWVENPENGLAQKKISDKYEFLVQYKPTDYVIVNEIREERVEKSKYDKLKVELSGIEYFDFKIRRIDGQPLFEEEKDNFKSMYIIDLMQQDFSLVIDSDTLPCILYHSEASGNSTPYKTILLGFERNRLKKDIDDMNLVFSDQIFKTGKNVFTISEKDIKNIPLLKIY